MTSDGEHLATGRCAAPGCTARRLGERQQRPILCRTNETPLVTIHPAAAALGYRFVEVTLDRGYRGPYQRIAVSRAAD